MNTAWWHRFSAPTTDQCYGVPGSARSHARRFGLSKANAQCSAKPPDGRGPAFDLIKVHYELHEVYGCMRRWQQD